jgi:hypothetical protein
MSKYSNTSVYELNPFLPNCSYKRKLVNRLLVYRGIAVISFTFISVIIIPTIIIMIIFFILRFRRILRINPINNVARVCSLIQTLILILHTNWSIFVKIGMNFTLLDNSSQHILNCHEKFHWAPTVIRFPSSRIFNV